MRYHEIITEDRHIWLTDDRGRDYSVIENPIPAQLKNVIRHAPYNEVKGLLSPSGDRVFIWAADHGHHMEIHGYLHGMTRQDMGLDGPGDIIPHPEMKRWTSLHVYADGILLDYPEYGPLLDPERNRMVRRMYRDHPIFLVFDSWKKVEHEVPTRGQAITESVSSLSQITVRDIIRAIPHADHDIQVNGWLGRAFHAVDGKPRQSMIDDLAKDLDRVRAELQAWIDAPTPLLRGLRKPPEEGRSIGKHWSDYRYTAISHGHYVLHAEIAPHDIDWLSTVMRRMCWVKEREFSLRAGTQVHYQLEFDGKIVGEGTGTV